MGFTSKKLLINQGIRFKLVSFPTGPYYAFVRDFSYGSGVYVGMLDQGDNKGIYSVDGLNWSLANLPTTPIPGTWLGVAFGNNIFVAISGTTTGAYSSNGINWTSMTVPNNLQCITFANGMFLAIGLSPTSGASIAARSTNGTSWTQVTIPGFRGAQSIDYGNGIFLSKEYDATARSSDGINWSVSATPPGGTTIAFGNGLFVSRSGNTFQRSIDGINWNSSTASNLPNTGGPSISYGRNVFLTSYLGEGSIAYSSDAINWTQSNQKYGYWYSSKYLNGKFFIGGGNEILVSN
jgi:hypothetical protein